MYIFFVSDIYKSIISESNTIINLASTEYSKSVTPYLKDNDNCITCTFKVMHKGTYKVQATAAKMARGKRVQYIVKNQIQDPEELKKFDEDGYRFEEALSTKNNYVFLQN